MVLNQVRLQCSAMTSVGLLVMIAWAIPARADLFSSLLLNQQVAVGQLPDLKKRHTADTLLKRAREALRDNNLQLAEFYVESAERLDIEYESLFAKFNDSPTKVREAIAQRRVELERNGVPTSRTPGNLPSDRFDPQTVYDSSMANTPPRSVQPPVTLAGLDNAGPLSTAGVGKSDAVGYLQKGRRALEEGNLIAAIGWYKSAAVLGAVFAEDEYAPHHLRSQLIEAGVGLEQLVISPEVTVRAPPPGYVQSNAQPADTATSNVHVADSLIDPQSRLADKEDKVSSSGILARAAKIHAGPPAEESRLATDRQRVMQLLAQAQAALDRGELDLSEQFALRAQELQLPESSYIAGDPRPWMVLMEIGKAHKRRYSIPNHVGAPNIFGPPSVAAVSAPVSQLPQVTFGNYPDTGNANYVTSTGAEFPSSQPFPPAQFIPSTPGALDSSMVPGIAVAVPVYQAPLHATSTMGVPQSTPGTAVSGTIVPQPVQGTPSSGIALQQFASPPPAPFDSPSAVNFPQTALGPLSPPATALAPPPAVPMGANGNPSSGSSSPFVTAPQLTTGPPGASTHATPSTLPPLSPPAAVPGQLSTLSSKQPTTATSSGAGSSADPTLAIDNPFQTAQPMLTSPPQVDARVASKGNEGTLGGSTEPSVPVGEQLYREGVAALQEGRLDQARELFRDAWAFESQLDPDSRQKLKDYLQHLRQQPLGQTSPEVPRELALDDRTAPESDVANEAQTYDESQKAALQLLIREVATKRISVQALRQNNPKRAWDELQDVRDQIANASIEEESRGQLLRRVDEEITELESYINQNRSRLENDERNRQVLTEIDRRREQMIQNQQKLAELVEEFNQLMEQQRYPEAVVKAKAAREIDPHNPVVQNMLAKSQTARQVVNRMIRDENFQTASLEMFNSIDEAAIGPTGETGLTFPKSWDELTKRRKNLLARQQRRYSEVELEIQQALKKQVEVQFNNESLSQVVDHLAKMTSVNVYLDPEGLAAEGVTSDTRISIDLRKPVSLKSALNLILQPLHLSYVIQDEVLRITSEQVRDGDVYTEPYNVADLVIPIPNFVPNYNVGLPGAIREAHRVINQQSGIVGGVSGQPLTIMANNPGMGPASSSASVLLQMGAAGMLGAGYSDGIEGLSAGGGSMADFDTLIDLITSTIEPNTWEELGGPGAINGFAGTLSLVVSQTQDVHERIVDLLEQLRRLQDLQVTIEVRFIILNDDFFERIGIDFDFDVNDRSGLTRPELENLQLSNDRPNVVIGLDPTGVPTLDLDIPFRQNSFVGSRPIFGGFTPDAAATIGFAILSDIEAFFLIEASQGNTRSNVLQAPKVTLFNGQTASVSDTSQRPFVTSVIPVVGDFAAAHQPVVTVLSEGTSLSVQAVVSQDRRFIRLTLVPFFSQIGDVDTFTFSGVTSSDTGTTAPDPANENSSVRNNQRNTIEGVTVQLPTLSFTTVNTTVSVPDGGTILLGGIKRLSEGRNELGVPMLSKIPYVNRLFKNVGIGRETQSLMMMVTPRIIIQEEEEEKLLGSAP